MRNLSSAGIQVQAQHPFKVGDTSKVRIESEHAALKGLEADTQVVWVRDEDDGKHVGLKILKMH